MSRASPSARAVLTSISTISENKLDCIRLKAQVGRAAETGVSQLRANDVSFPSDDNLSSVSFVKAKVNYRAKLRDAKVHMQGDELVVDFLEPLRAAAPGQAVVLYINDRVIAGGTITSFT